MKRRKWGQHFYCVELHVSVLSSESFVVEGGELKVGDNRVLLIVFKNLIPELALFILSKGISTNEGYLEDFRPRKNIEVVVKAGWS